MLKRFKLVIAFIVFIIFLYNLYIFFNITIDNKTYKSSKVPKSFNGFRILQLTDFHNKKFYRKEFLIKTIIAQRPDVIFITGDFVDSRIPDLKWAYYVISELAPVTKIFYVLGNHEGRTRGIEGFLDKCRKLGVIVLRDDSYKLYKDSSYINIVGVDDPSIMGVSQLRKALRINKEKGKLNILLSHRPEIFDEYVNKGYDLIFSGHTHGGQVRLPIIGALFVPNQGIIPKYDKGVFKKDNSTMIVSSGIGTSLLPIRIFNKPELVLMELKNLD
ncbi:MAG: metallophosphoesterase [Lagierella massiliensis]|nr:metallophosphoesterase [Lagierella massiliensis]